MRNQITQKNTGFLGGGMQAIITSDGGKISQTTSEGTQIVIQTNSINIATTAQELETLVQELIMIIEDTDFNSVDKKEQIVCLVKTIKFNLADQDYEQAINDLSQLKRKLNQISSTENVEVLMKLLSDY